MSTKKSIKTEQEITDVLVHQDKSLSEIHFPEKDQIDCCIAESEALLRSLGYHPEASATEADTIQKQTIMTIPSWDELCKEAETHVGTGHNLEQLFTEDELEANRLAVRELNQEFSTLHKLDRNDIAIAAIGGMLGALVDILLVGIPKKTQDGLKAGPLSDYLRSYFDKKYPEEEMQRLANSKVSKVSFDAQDNRHTTIHVEGLSAYYHRLLQLGHDPVLGFIFGLADILNGTMTTIDKQGKVVCQVMKNYSDRREADIFSALCKLIVHFKSDITTSMGLPVPLMSLFNLLQFGNIGEEELTIAETVQGMYYEGYDFIHFCSMSVPTMITEVVIRLGYGIKRMKEGHGAKDSIPFSLNRGKHPKLATMLFIGHSAAAAVNAGKVIFCKNPMAINYPQWIAFAKYSYIQLKWVLIEKPERCNSYVMGRINEELDAIMREVDQTFDSFAGGRYIAVMN